MEEILSVAATKLHQCVRRHALLHPPAATFSTACLHVTATITLIYARAYLTVQIHSAHNGMMQRKKKKDINPQWKHWDECFRCFLSMSPLPSWGLFERPLCGLSVALCTYLLGTAAERGHKRTFQDVFGHVVWRRTPAPI